MLGFCFLQVQVDIEKHLKCVPCVAKVGDTHALAGGFKPDEGVCLALILVIDLRGIDGSCTCNEVRLCC